MTNLKRQLVLISLAVIIEVVLILSFPSHFRFIFLFTAFSLLCFWLFNILKKQYSIAIVASILIIACAANTYRVYLDAENYVNKLIDKHNYIEITCSADVKECHHYSSFSVIFANITHMNGKTLEKPFSARLSSYTAGSIKDGDSIEFSGKMIHLHDIEEDDFDTSTYLRSKAIFADFPYAEIISSHAASKKPILTKLREYTRSVLYKYLPDDFDFRASSVAYAVLAGDKDYMVSETKDIFKQSGLSHLISVSGMHLSIIAGFLFTILSALTLHKNAKCIITILFCIFYTAFTGFSLSTVRACIMCTVSFSAMIVGKKSDMFSSLFFSAIAILLFSPYSVFDISLILSFFATLGILCVCNLIQINSFKNVFLRIFLAITALILCNIGAITFTLPVAAFFFRNVSHVSAASSLLAAFPCEILLMSLLLLLILSPLSAFSASLPVLFTLGHFCNRICLIIIDTAEYFSSLKYSYTPFKSSFAFVFLCIFFTLAIILTLFIALGSRCGTTCCVTLIIILSIILSFTCLYKAIRQNETYSVRYFRQNENDRQLSIRLCDKGYLIINADNFLCEDSRKSDFDHRNHNNYLLLIPDSTLNPSILSQSIKTFDEKFGIKKIFVPKTNDGTELALELMKDDIECFYMPSESQFGKIQIKFESSDFQKIHISDETTTSSIVFADKYNSEYFDKKSDICAFFTRKTKNQFDKDTDAMPRCEIFFTRMGKNDNLKGIQNTYNLRDFYIKE